MRESLTIFAIALILVLSALLVGPYLVDWNGQRDWLAAKLSHAVGAQVRIAGPIDVKLLPRPIFRAAQVSIVGTEAAAPRFSAARLDAELSLNGLLQGTIEFVDARLTEPRLDLTMQPDGSIVAPSVAPDKADRIQFSHLSIAAGQVVVLDTAGKTIGSLNGIDADGEAETLFGPIKMSGSAGTAQGPVTFRFNTGAYHAGQFRLHLVLDRKGPWSHADADGQVVLAAVRPKGVKPAGVSFAGSIGLSGAVEVAAAAAPVPWRVTATGVTADPRTFAATAVELRAGQDGRALVANGSVAFDGGDKPSGLASFRARQLDLDHIAVPTEAAPDAPAPSAEAWLGAVREALGAAPALPFALHADMGIDAITSGDLTLTDFAAALDAHRDAPPHVSVGVAGPNDSRAHLEGTVELGAAPAFDGQVDAATRNIAAAAGWVAPLTGALPEGVDGALRGQSGAFKAAVKLSTAGMVARQAAVTLGATTLDGTLSATPASATEPPRLFADFTAGALDPGQWLGLHQILTLTDPIDFDVALRSDAVTLTRSDAGVAQTARIALHATKTGSDIALDRLSLSGLGDAALDATATLEGGTRFQAQGRASARDLASVVAAIGQNVPDLRSDTFTTRLSALAPLDSAFKLSGRIGADGSIAPEDVSLSGSAASTRFSLSIEPASAATGPAAVTAALLLDSPDAGRVLRQAGWPGRGDLGALHLDAHGQGSLDTGFDGRITATLPKTSLSFAGQVGRADGHGRLTFDSGDLAPLLQAITATVPVAGRTASLSGDLSWNEASVDLAKLGGRVAGSGVSGDLAYRLGPAGDGGGHAPVTGEIRLDTASLGGLIALGIGLPSGTAAPPSDGWSSVPFAVVPTWPVSDVAVRVGTLDLWPGLVGRETALNVQLRPDTVTLAGLSTQVLGGSVRGSFTLRRNGSGASVAGQGTFDKLNIALPSLTGRLSGQLNLAGSGATPASLIGSLAGDGTLALAGATEPKLAPSALLAVAAKFAGDSVSIEGGAVTDALAKELDKGSVALGDLTGPATVAAGVVRVAGVRSTLPDATVASDAALDLARSTLDLRTTVTAGTLPPDWKGDPPHVTVTWKGPLFAPVRSIDDGEYVNGLAARAIAREQERIELMKDDLRERAFFARRLKQIEAEQQAAREAPQVAKTPPQPPQRPADIRLPKPPDVGAPTMPLSLRPGSAAQQDAITQFLNGSSRVPSRLGPGGTVSAPPAIPTPTRGGTSADPGLY